MVNSPSGFNALDQQIPQNNSSERKVYIDRRTGNIVDTINSNKIENYIETDTKQVVYIDIQKEFSDGNNAISTTPVMGGKVMSVLQYEQYKIIQQQVKNIYNNAGQDKHRIMLGAMKTIVDSKIDFPTQVSDIQRLQMYAMIKAMGQADAQTLLNNNSQTQSTSVKKDSDLQIEALMRQLDKNKPLEDVPSSLQNTNSESPLGFFDEVMYKQDTGLLWRPRIVQNSTNIINGVEIKGTSIAISGNGLRLRAVRRNILTNRFIDKLSKNNPDIVLNAIFGLTRRKKFLGNPEKFREILEKKLKKIEENELKNQSPENKQKIIKAFYKAVNTRLQQQINQTQSIMR